MEGKVFCFASAKGGSGKTIISANLGTALAHLGKKVLLIDADGSTNGMTLLYLERVLEARNAPEQSTDPLGMFDQGKQDVNRLAIEIRKGLWLLPATYVMMDTHEVSRDEFGRSFDAVILQYEREFDYILVDAQAGIEDFALAAIERADQTIVVSEYDPISKKGVDRLKNLIKSGQTPRLLFNKVLPEFVASIGDPLGLSELVPPIPWNADVVRAYVKGTLALDMEKGNIFTIGLLRTAGALFGRGVQDLVEEWRKGKDDFIRAPIRKQLDKVVDELEGVRKAQVSAEFEATSGTRVTLYFWMIAALFIGGIASGFTYSVLRERQVLHQVDQADEYLTLVEKGLAMLSSLEKREELLARRDNVMIELGRLYKHIEGLANTRLLMVGITVIAFVCFAAYFLWRTRSGEQRKLDLLHKAAFYSERVDDLRSIKAQLMAYEQSSLDELIQRDV